VPIGRSDDQRKFIRKMGRGGYDLTELEQTDAGEITKPTASSESVSANQREFICKMAVACPLASLSLVIFKRLCPLAQ
jgi:hypothetical protein